jgi:hypothetical protein
VDPLSILFAANACVAAIKQGCKLYKDAKTSFMEIKKTVDEVVSDAKQVRSFWQKLFGTDPEPASSKPVAKKKEAYVAVDETQVMADIVTQLTKLFRLEEQLATHIREAEEQSKNVYDPDANLMEAALQRVMAQQQMAELIVTVREAMVYQSPPEMGALYSKVFEMREIIGQEQEQARLKEEARQRYKQWQRREAKRNFQAKSTYLIGTTIFLLYLWFLLLLVNRWGKT